MKYRSLGKTGLKVSEIGYGAWGIGGALWHGASDSESMKALNKAVDCGINFFDTALFYGDGHSERLIGKLLKERRDGLIVATKIPPKNLRWPAREGSSLREIFPASHIRESTEQSLRNLGVECIDLQQFHVWLDDWTDDQEWIEEVAKLREERKIRFLGISINNHEPRNALRLIRSGRVDTVQVIYNIFDQSPEDELFPECQRSGIGIIARVPFDEGALTGSVSPATRFEEKDFRNWYFRGDRKTEVWERVRHLEPLVGAEASTLAELALRFCLHHSALSTVIPGMRTESHVEANCALSDGRDLSAETVQELRKHRWKKNYYR